MGFSAVLVEGDGVGPEVVASAVEAIDAAGVDVSWRRFEAGKGAYERYGCTAPESTLAAIRNIGAALKGPFETPSGGSVHSANFYIRTTLDLYACLRPLPVSDREVLQYARTSKTTTQLSNGGRRRALLRRSKWRVTRDVRELADLLSNWPPVNTAARLRSSTRQTI